MRGSPRFYVFALPYFSFFFFVCENILESEKHFERQQINLRKYFSFILESNYRRCQSEIRKKGYSLIFVALLKNGKL